MKIGIDLFKKSSLTKNNASRDNREILKERKVCVLRNRVNRCRISIHPVC